MADVAVAGVDSGVPTVADARRAAEVPADAGAGRVLLYGSVASGEQTPDSDIDLVAVFDDLGDYADRWRRKGTLAEAARKACGSGAQGRDCRHLDAVGAAVSSVLVMSPVSGSAQMWAL